MAYTNTAAHGIAQQKENWKKIVRVYAKPDHKKSWWQVFNTLVPYLLLWTLAYQLSSFSFWPAFIICVVMSFFMCRLFIIMHDCGHGSFHESKKVRTFIGYLTGVITLTPYWQWTKDHATHHSNSGNLDKRGVGDIWTMTTKEYEEAKNWDKLLYRLYRFPVVTFILGPFYNFVIRHRFTRKIDGPLERRSVYITNILLALIYGALFTFLDPSRVFFVSAISTFFVLVMGVWLFYVQHQYEGVYWQYQEKWDYFDAAIKGSSFYKLPKILQWASGNIGFHHLHHLSHLIPNYNLQKAHEENTLFQDCKVLTLFESFKSLTLHLIDLENQTLISFAEYKKRKKQNESFAKYGAELLEKAEGVVAQKIQGKKLQEKLS